MISRHGPPAEPGAPASVGRSATGRSGRAVGPAAAGDRCPACGEDALKGSRPEWTLRCGSCGLWRSSLGSRDGRLLDQGCLDEGRRAAGLKPLRERNNETVLDAIAGIRGIRGLRILDVGSGHGWFVDAAARRGAEAEGIEPDPGVAARAVESGRTVTVGYFPEALPEGATYDVICFNDVLEHIVDVGSALAACRERLRPGGLLAVSVPDADGTLFRAASLLRLAGWTGPWERLWQAGYPSPHVSYFDETTLRRLAAGSGFAFVTSRSLATLTLRGLWQRLHMDRPVSPASCLLAAALVVARILLLALPADQSLFVFRPGAADPATPGGADRPAPA